MSRLESATPMTPAAIRAVLAPESGDDLIILLTIYDPDDETQIVARLADGFIQRLSSSVVIGDASTGGATTYSTDDDDIIYGVVSRGENYLYLPLEITLPDETDGRSSRASIVIYDVTQYLTPLIRSINGPPKIKLEIILSSTPNIPEVVFTDFYIYNITYNKDTVTADLSMINYDREPFPQHTFTPAYFPGLF